MCIRDRYYTAREKRNPGRLSYLIEFRHPLKSEGGKPGKKIRKGLGTDDETEAQRLVADLNELLAQERFWSLGARNEAEKQFDLRVVDIFYSEIEPKKCDSRALRDISIPFPAREDGYARILLIGVPGAGKTTLLRQIIGSHPTRDRFPSTSVNRTTIFPTEVIMADGAFSAVVTFMSEHETRFELEECISRAIVEAIGENREKVATTFLKPSDMRFRLDYCLGEYHGSIESKDPYDYDFVEEQPQEITETTVSEEDSSRIGKYLDDFIDRIITIARKHREQVCVDVGPLEQLKPCLLYTSRCV